MGLNFSISDVHKKARELVSLLQNLRSICESAKSSIPAKTYDSVMPIPSVISQFSQYVATLQADSITIASLGPAIVEIYDYPAPAGGDWSGIDSEYQALKLAALELHSWIITNSSIFRHSMDSSGTRIYNIEIDSVKSVELEANLDAVLAMFVD